MCVSENITLYLSVILTKKLVRICMILIAIGEILLDALEILLPFRTKNIDCDTNNKAGAPRIHILSHLSFLLLFVSCRTQYKKGVVVNLQGFRD